jgi:hypothetical protein
MFCVIIRKKKQLIPTQPYLALFFLTETLSLSIITHQQMHQNYLLFKLCFNNSH